MIEISDIETSIKPSNKGPDKYLVQQQATVEVKDVVDLSATAEVAAAIENLTDDETLVSKEEKAPKREPVKRLGTARPK